jgi:hypothetical protein
MTGYVVSFDGNTRCGSVEDEVTERRYHFTAVSFNFPCKVGQRFEFDWIQEPMRRVAVNMRRIDERAVTR